MTTNPIASSEDYHLEKDQEFMALAMEQAKIAAQYGEVPVGAIVCREGEIVSAAYNRRELDKNALAHAETLAIGAACEKLGGWRLHQCELYVTLEPCPMCMGAIINARIRRVIFGAYDRKAGCLGSLIDLTQIPFNHKPEVTGGIMAEECGALLTDFFSALRRKG